MALSKNAKGGKHKMRELLVSSGMLEADCTRQRCNYYIVVDEMQIDGAPACESYGNKDVGWDGEVAVIPHITISISRIDELAELLLRNGVTPTTLRDVVEDWL